MSPPAAPARAAQPGRRTAGATARAADPDRAPSGDPHGEAHAGRRRTRVRAGARDAVAGALRALRERAGLSQEKLGERAGLHRTYVGGYERAERRLTIEAVEQVLAALDVSWAAFGAEMDARVRRRAARELRGPASPPTTETARSRGRRT